MNPNEKRISGIDPRLAITNAGRTECGIGAVASFGGRLYWITYAASGAHGDDNGLYSMDGQGAWMRHPESVGGTHANRFVHERSGQLILGAYCIDAQGRVRTLDPKALQGRLTGTGAHLIDPENWVYLNTMEDGLYEVNVRTLQFRRLRRDRFEDLKDPALQMLDWRDKLPGDHGKGGYTGQGVFIVSNNGHGGVLAEWDGRGDAQALESWRVVDRAKYTEITGPGGLQGPQSAGDPIWALGWDHRSVLLNVRWDGGWTRYRLPKASYTQDADHGWYTEWPRIRRVAQDQYLLCMHGMFYRFPGQFTPRQTGGIKPLSRHLKMIVDFEAWQGGIAFACDDASVMENPLCCQQQSNLWFAAWDDLERLGSPAGWGGVYAHDAVRVGMPSEPFFVGGFDRRVLHLSHGDSHAVGFHIEADVDHSGLYREIRAVTVPAHGYAWLALEDLGDASWVRLRADRDVTDCCAFFYVSSAEETPLETDLVRGLHPVASPAPFSAGRLRPLPGSDLRLQYVPEGRAQAYSLDGDLRWTAEPEPLEEPAAAAPNPSAPLVRVLPHSVRLIDGRGQAYHLPKTDPAYDDLSQYRVLREVVTERSLLNVHGTIYELPRFESEGVRRMKPIATHGLSLTDFCSWRGLLVLSGVDRGAAGGHILAGEDGEALWAGNVDDLWRMGPPRGEGAPAYDTPLAAGMATEPMLMAGYRSKEVRLSHDAAEPVTMTLEVDFLADGCFHPYARWIVAPGQEWSHCFPEAYGAHWARVRVDRDCRATARFLYR